ncbi:glycosyltransferase [Aquabacterium humicola]|uniref:glycosyltransferase n=1 Tax=Aquabacterium humicola TaxID=3237377 RepID=UPI002542C9B7|nr:glycosyltransferase [Rubrivivax pictus]
MRVLFCTTGGLGHLMPLRPLASALRCRGHEVAWVTAPDALPVLRDEGFDLFAAGPTFEASRRQFREAHADAALLTGERLSAYAFPRLFGAVLGPAMLEGVDQAVRHWLPDLVVTEPAALAVPLVCETLGLRHLTHGYGLRPPRAYLENALRFFAPQWRARGLDAPAGGSPHRQLDLDIAPPSLQPAAARSHDGVFRYNAHRPAPQVPFALPGGLRAALQRSSARGPRLYVTFGTVFNRSAALIAAARAAARLGGTVVVTAGADGDLQGLAGLGAHVHVHRFVDQAALLPHCDVVVSHGGAGTMLGAAAHGVPHLVLPQAADHFRNGRALCSAGAGRTVEPEWQTEAAVTASLSAVLTSAALESGASALAREMAAMPDARAAAMAVERWNASAPCRTTDAR